MVLATQHPVRLQAQLLHGLSDPSRLRVLEVLRGDEERARIWSRQPGSASPTSPGTWPVFGAAVSSLVEKRGREVYYWLIDGVADLLGAVDAVLDKAGETVGACSMNEPQDGCC